MYARCVGSQRNSLITSLFLVYYFFALITHIGGPAVFVLSWAIIKVFAVDNIFGNVDGVSYCIAYYTYMYIYIHIINI